MSAAIGAGVFVGICAGLLSITVALYIAERKR